MRSEIGIRIDASRERVFALAGDIERWHELLPHYARVDVQARQGERALIRMVALRPLGRLRVPVAWRAVYWPDASDSSDLRLRFRHVRGLTKGMDVTWHIRAAEDSGGSGSSVKIVHTFRRSLPVVGEDFLPALIDRFFTRPIARRTLAAFKALAEAET